MNFVLRKFLCQIGSVINYTRPLEKNINKKGKLDIHGWIFFPCSQQTTQPSCSERENLINLNINDQQFPQISSLLWWMLAGSLLISPSPSENSSHWCQSEGSATWDPVRSHQGMPRCGFFQAGPPRKALPRIPAKLTLQILYSFLPQHHLIITSRISALMNSLSMKLTE